ncbi:MAG TPA: hypothetical protein VF857_07840 [Spirochaetota bacterium]
MKFLIPLCISTMFVIGCATFQEPVDDSLLKEMTQQQKDLLAKIGSDIIAKKAEKDGAETQVAISEQGIEVSKSQLAFIDAQRDLSVKKEKLYRLSNDSAQQTTAMNGIKACDTQKIQETAHLDYIGAKRDVDKAVFSVKEAELGVLVAQLDFEKAKIARENQEKRKKSDDDSMIDVKKYEEYYNKQKENLAQAQQDLKKANDALLLADDKLKKSGFGGQK